MDMLPVYSLTQFDALAEDFYVSDLAYHLKTHHFIHIPHKHDFYLCVVFTKGTGEHEIDFVNYEIKPGSVFFLTPGKFHNWKFTTPVEGYIFFHSKAFYNLNYQNRQIQDFPFYYSEYNTPALYTVQDELKEVGNYFKQLILEAKQSTPFKSVKLCSLVDLIYIELARIYLPEMQTKTRKSDYSIKLRQLETLVDAHYIEKKMPAEYASLMNMSTKHLNRIVKTSLNITVSKFIADRIVLAAKRLLVHSDYRVVEVSDQLGFSDHSYFNRYFKKHAGQTPVGFASAYRKF